LTGFLTDIVTFPLFKEKLQLSSRKFDLLIIFVLFADFDCLSSLVHSAGIKKRIKKFKMVGSKMARLENMT